MRSLKERQRIHRTAELKLGISKDGGDDGPDHFEFMSQCMQDKLESGEADDVWDAEDLCQIEWDDQQDGGENDDGEP